MYISLAKTFISNNVYRGVSAKIPQRGINFYSHRLVTDFIEKDNKQSAVQPENNQFANIEVTQEFKFSNTEQVINSNSSIKLPNNRNCQKSVRLDTTITFDNNNQEN